MKKFFKSINLYVTNLNKLKFIYFFCVDLFHLYRDDGLGLIGFYVLATSDTSLFISKIPFEFISNYLSNQNKFQIITYLSATLILAFIFKSLITVFFAYFEASVQKSIIISNSSKLYQIYLKKPYSYFLKHNPQKLVNNINHVLKLGIQYIFYNLFLFLELILIIFLVFGSFYIRLKIYISVFLILTVVSAFIFLVKKKLSLLGSQIVSSGQTIFKDLNEGLRGIKITKIIKNYKFLKKNFISGLEVREGSQLKHSIIQKIPRAMLETFSVTMLVFITIMLITNIDDPNKVFPILAVLSLILIRLVPSFTNINFALSNLQYTSYAYNILITDLSKGSLEEEIDSKLRDTRNQYFDLNKNLNVRLKNISFQYENAKKESLKNVSIEFNTNSIIGFVGKSGSGKSTIFNIIIGLLLPTEGYIEIENKERYLTHKFGKAILDMFTRCYSK